MDKLGLEPDTPSKTVVITANGTRERALGQISNLKIYIQDMIIPIKLQVIESREETLLLGTDWFEKMKAQWNFDTQTLKIYQGNRTIEIKTSYLSDLPPQLIIDEEDDKLIDEIEYDEEDDLEEQEAYISDGLYEIEETIFDDNPAVYLTESSEEIIKKTEIGILNEDQQETIDQLLKDNNDIFIKSISKEGQATNLGRTTVVTHNINTGNAQPIKQRPYKTSPDQLNFIKEEITSMLQKGIISPTTSPWSSPVVIVPKKNNKKCLPYASY